jgi:hypothetical protein
VVMQGSLEFRPSGRCSSLKVSSFPSPPFFNLVFFYKKDDGN